MSTVIVLVCLPLPLAAASRFDGIAHLENLVHRPPICHQIVNGVEVESATPTTFSRGQFFSINEEPTTNGTILCLLGSRNPAAVFRAIVAIIVFTFKGKSGRWALPHISQEIQKPIRTKPSVAHFYAASAVCSVGGISRIITTSFCGTPRRVFWSTTQAVRLFKTLNHFQSKTSATFRPLAFPVRTTSFCNEKCSLNHSYISTVASALPPNTVAWDTFDDNQPSKSLASQISENAHCNSS